MPQIPLGRQAYQRDFANEIEIQCLNRFFETNPTNPEDQVSLLARPGSTPLVTTSDVGLVRGFYSHPGFFNGDLFFVTGTSMYRYTTTGTLIPISSYIENQGQVSMTFMIGAGYEYLFITDGTLLQYYKGGVKGTSVLTVTGSITNQVIQIGANYYTWGTSPHGVAAGTAASPWVATLGGTTAQSLQNMVNLLSFTGALGTDFSSNLGGQNPDVTAVVSGNTIVLTSKSDLSSANSIATTVYSGTGMAFGTTTITGAGVHVLYGIEMPNGLPVKSCASLASHVLLSITGSNQFYFLRPGSLVVDPLDFATAESQPDVLQDLVTVGDTVWMIGEGHTEAWYATGDSLSPFQPTQGRVYDRGAVPGTAVKVKDEVIIVGFDGIVYSIGRGVQRISHHGIEERIRTQLKRESGT